MKYCVEISELLSRVITIDACSEKEAYSLVKNLYDSGSIELDWSNLIQVKINVLSLENNASPIERKK